jgi:hypothetical protein
MSLRKRFTAFLTRLRQRRNRRRVARALRSGKYKQSKNRLTTIHDDGITHCCLGVACEVYQKYVGDLLVVDKPKYSDTGYAVRAYDWAEATLPKKVMDWLGMTDNGRFVAPTAFCSLIQLNDDLGKSFVDCEVFIQTGGKLLRTESVRDDGTMDVSYVSEDGKGESHTLPRVVQEWIGMTAGGQFADHEDKSTLIHQNDFNRMSFTGIANLIETADFHAPLDES